jgi:ketosteroid isomerase-like protein
MTARSLDEAIQESHAALGAISNGDVEPYMALYSDSENVTLGNPFGPFVRGKEAVRGAGERAASRYRDGQVAGFERVATHVADGLACVAGAGHFRAKVGGIDVQPTLGDKRGVHMEPCLILGACNPSPRIRRSTPAAGSGCSPAT